MNRKLQLINLIEAKIKKMRTQELKEVRDLIISIELRNITRREAGKEEYI